METGELSDADIGGIELNIGFASRLAQRSFYGETESLVEAPHDEHPCCAVPQPAETHRDHEVAIGRCPSAAVPAERHIEIVTKPSRQGHVPTTPEVLDRDGGIGPIEVLREPEAEQQGEPDRHVGVAGEVGIDLDCVAINPEQDIPRRVLPRRAKASLTIARPMKSAITTFLTRPRAINSVARLASTRSGVRSPGARKELRGPDDRPSDKLGEE